MVLGLCACGGYRGSKSSFPTFAASAVPASGAAAGAPGGAASGAPGSGGAAGADAVPELPQQLVIEGSLQVSVAEIKDLVPALRAHVEQLGGVIAEEEVSGLDADWQAHVKLRVPPQQLEAVVTWLAGRGEITDKQIRSSDVAKTLFDQELALKNAQVTSERLEALLRQGGLTMADVLAVERELTRLRGEIEAIRGQAAFLKDRVALSTLDVGMTRKTGTVHIAQAKAYPGGRFSALILLDPEGRARTRLGGGFAMHLFFRVYTLELELYESKPDGGAGADESMAVITTVGGAMYSDFLGRGERKFGNPFLGFRTGYGYLDSHRWVVQAEAGVELVKTKRFMLDASVRLTGLIGEDVDAAAIVGGSAVVAF